MNVRPVRKMPADQSKGGRRIMSDEPEERRDEEREESEYVHLGRRVGLFSEIFPLKLSRADAR